MRPAEFKGTVIANYAEVNGNPDARILSYMNTAQAEETSGQYGMLNAGPNAMVFPIYGEVTKIAECSDPEASRDWLSTQYGVYREEWKSSAIRFRSKSAGGYDFAPVMAGNYLVKIANGVEGIPGALSELRRSSPLPEHVPGANDAVLDMMDRFYRQQSLGMPRFAIAAFALAPHQVEAKNPITLHYEQFSNLRHHAVFPALDYHGKGDFLPIVKRDHRLLLSTPEIDEIFRSTMESDDNGERPAEFAALPAAQFPVEVADSRSSSHIAVGAPNNDYMFNIAQITSRLQSVQGELAQLTPPDAGVYDLAAETYRTKAIGRIVTEGLGRYGLMGYSNQPNTTAEAFATTGSLNTRNFAI